MWKTWQKVWMFQSFHSCVLKPSGHPMQKEFHRALNHA